MTDIRRGVQVARHPASSLPGGVPGSGDYPVRPRTAWSIELNAKAPVPEWGGSEVLFMLEEGAFFDGERVEYIDGRQTELILIPDDSLAEQHF